MKKLISVVDRWSSVPLGVIGVSGTRALLGFVGLMFYVSQYADRDYLFGPTAVLPWRDFVTQLHEGVPSACTPGVPRRHGPNWSSISA